MTAWTPSGELIVAGTRFATDAPIVNWTEGPRWDATSERCQPTASDPHPACTVDPRTGNHIPYGKMPLGPYTRRYSTRPALRAHDGGMHPPLDAVQAVVRQFVIHHDGCSSADMCFSVVHNERGCSVHFLIDNDGTIFQTLDLALMGYHASEWNPASIGVELCNRGDAAREPHYYDGGRFGPRRAAVPCRINGATLLAFEYTTAQLDALTRLGRALRRVLPNLPAEYPQTAPGVQSWTTLPRADSLGFTGYIGHYHLTAQKWDPGPFDFRAACDRLRGAPCFPLAPRRAVAATATAGPPRLADDADQLRADADALYAANERRAGGGFFPVGPWGEARLWHGGVHVVAAEGAAIYAPLAGRLVAARMGAGSPIGPVNFVLLRHDVAVGVRRRALFSLYMHVRDELAGGRDRPAWLDRTKAAPREVVLVDEPIEAGAVIAHVASVGPGALARPQVHVETFAATELFAGAPGSPWTVVDGTAAGRFCDAPEVDAAIDRNGDGRLDRAELSAFYAGGGAAQLRYLVTLHVSEWTAEPSWRDALCAPRDFAGLSAADIDRLVAAQITPGLWWDARVAAHCKLPADGVVFHYHPISLLAWLHRRQLDAAACAEVVDGRAATVVPAGITDDLGDVDAAAMRGGEPGDDCDARLTLAALADGFATPPCR